jgi:hypothetical protein
MTRVTYNKMFAGSAGKAALQPKPQRRQEGQEQVLAGFAGGPKSNWPQTHADKHRREQEVPGYAGKL